MFQKYQSLPKIVEAVQFTAENKDMVFNSLTGPYAADFENDSPILKVTTIHGETAIVRLGDWIVKDAMPGTYYPVKNDIFCAGYEGMYNKKSNKRRPHNGTRKRKSTVRRRPQES